MEKKIDQNFTKKFNKIKKILNINKFLEKYVIEFLTDDTLLLSYENKKVCKAKYNFYGLYRNSQFIWATSMPLVKESFKDQIKKIKKTKKQFYDDYINNQNELSYFYYSLLDNDTILVPQKYLPYINKLIIYLTDDIFIINPANSKESVQYISLTEITENFTE
tara:strand:- start:43 stop:531 length:489 start_codon:yes stop_codon:yes gene_type:complete